MRIVKPDFYDNFKCKADKCTDSCCIGWEIDVDFDTYEKYKSLKTDFALKILDNIGVSEDGERCFKLTENERCPFLNENNLCEIIINAGEEFICDICKAHPRFFNDFSGVSETGHGLCCEESVRLLLDCERFTIITEDDGKYESFSDIDLIEKREYEFLFEVREKIFSALNKDVSYSEKIKQIKKIIENETGEKLNPLKIEDIIKLYEQTEPINEAWTEYLSDLKNNSSEYSKAFKRFYEEVFDSSAYSKILSFIIYRHLINAVFDGALCERTAFSINAVEFIIFCDIKTYYENGKLTQEDRINNIKRWSQQTEYSEENLDMLILNRI